MVEQMIQLAMDDFQDSEMLCGYAFLWRGSNVPGLPSTGQAKIQFQL